MIRAQAALFVVADGGNIDRALARHAIAFGLSLGVKGRDAAPFFPECGLGHALGAVV